MTRVGFEKYRRGWSAIHARSTSITRCSGCLNRNELAEALEAYNRLNSLGIGKDSEWIAATAVELSRRRGDYSSSMREARTGLKRHPHSSMLRAAAAWTLLEKKDTGGALEQARAGLALARDSGEFHELLAHIYIARKEYDDALLHIRQAMPLLPPERRLQVLALLPNIYGRGSEKNARDSMSLWTNYLKTDPQSDAALSILLRELSPDAITGLLNEIPALRNNSAYLHWHAQLAAPGPRGNAGASDLSGAAGDQTVDADLERALLKLAAVTERNHVCVCSHETAPETARRVAQAQGLQYIDLRPYFARRFHDRREYIAYDGVHCNTTGYGLMAEILAEEILHGPPGAPDESPAESRAFRSSNHTFTRP